MPVCSLILESPLLWVVVSDLELLVGRPALCGELRGARARDGGVMLVTLARFRQQTPMN